MTKFSCIIPAYNSEKFLKKCIKSVINQTYKDFEIIVINDGSTDKTGKIIEKFARKNTNVHFFTLKNNQGVGNARNIGIKNAKGDYLVFVDADDHIKKNYFSKIKNAINNLEEKNFDIIRCYIISKTKNHNINTKFIGKTISCENKGMIPDLNFATFSVYYRNFIVEKKLEFGPFKYSQDKHFLLQAYIKGARIYFSDIREYVYNQNNKESSSHKRKNLEYPFLEAQKEMIKLAEQNKEKFPELYKYIFNSIEYNIKKIDKEHLQNIYRYTREQFIIPYKQKVFDTMKNNKNFIYIYDQNYESDLQPLR